MNNPALSTAWLERANRLALAARLLASTVHDVNNSLQVISGNGELLELAASADPTIVRRGQTIRTHARRASGLLTELMAFVKDANEQVSPTSLRAIATQAVAMRQYALTKLRASVTVEGDAADVRANPRHVLQVALNLVSNAEQALGGRTSATLRLQVRQEGGRALLDVTDNGAGIDPSVEPRLFLLDSLTAASADSALGIGLGVSRWLIEEAGGTLSYARADAGGSTFTISLPAIS
jgi:two-component system C4-dicarboxylate transport sensor histidine kinase DctB